MSAVLETVCCDIQMMNLTCVLTGKACQTEGHMMLKFQYLFSLFCFPKKRVVIYVLILLQLNYSLQ